MSSAILTMAEDKVVCQDRTRSSGKLVSVMKQIIVMRTDLGMRKGKMIAQGAHASLGAVLPYVRTFQDDPEDTRRQDCVTAWLAGPFAKICVRVRSEEELLAVYEEATAAGLITCLITDSGRTEFHGVATKTCCAIGPDTDENLAPITGDERPGGRLELL